MLGPGGLTKHKIDKVVKNLGQATIGEENKDEILYHTNRFVSDFEKKKTRFRNRLAPFLNPLIGLGGAMVDVAGNSQVIPLYPYLKKHKRKGTDKKFPTNPIRRKNNQKRKQMTNKLKYKQYLDKNQQLMKRKGTERSWPNSIFKRYMPSLSNVVKMKGSHKNHNRRQDAGTLGMSVMSATEMILKLFMISVQGTTLLDGIVL